MHQLAPVKKETAPEDSFTTFTTGQIHPTNQLGLKKLLFLTGDIYCISWCRIVFIVAFTEKGVSSWLLKMRQVYEALNFSNPLLAVGTKSVGFTLPQTNSLPLKITSFRDQLLVSGRVHVHPNIPADRLASTCVHPFPFFLESKASNMCFCKANDPAHEVRDCEHQVAESLFRQCVATMRISYPP